MAPSLVHRGNAAEGLARAPVPPIPTEDPATSANPTAAVATIAVFVVVIVIGLAAGLLIILRRRREQRDEQQCGGGSTQGARF